MAGFVGIRTKDGATVGLTYNASKSGADEAICGFRFIPAGYSDLKPATVPI